MDGTGSDCLPEVYVIVGHVEFWRCYVGNSVVRRTAILELDQPGCHIDR